MTNTVEIRFVSEFVELLRMHKTTRRRLFRGQNVDRPLLPRIARLAEKNGILFQDVTDIERKMLRRFRNESLPMLRNTQVSSDWEWLAIAQHQGMPTRLLDWTSNALAGLWFAVAADAPDTSENGVVWVLEVDRDHETFPEKHDDIFALERTFIFQPIHTDRRITAQSAWFSVHKYVQGKGKFIPLEKNKSYRDNLTKIPISRKHFHSLRKELRLLGVSQVTIFPDLSGLGADIQAEYIDTPRPLPTI